MMRAAFALCLLSAGCQYGYDLAFADDEVISCETDKDCAGGERCGGIVSETEACSEDGFVRIRDGKVSSSPFDEPGIAFICYANARFFPFCVDDQLTVCETDDACNSNLICAAPLDGGAAECVESSSIACDENNSCSGGQECYAVFDVGEDPWQVATKCVTVP